MQLLITIAIVAPLIATACFLKAWKGSKIDNYKEDDCPVALKASLMNFNGPERSWGLRGSDAR